MIDDPGDARVVAERCPVRRGELAVGHVPARRVGQPGVGLEQAHVLVAKAPGRKAPHDLAGVEPLEQHAFGRHRCDIGIDVDLDAMVRLPRTDIEATGAEDDLRGAFALDLGPGVVRAFRQAHVVGAVVREPDDPR